MEPESSFQIYHSNRIAYVDKPKNRQSCDQHELIEVLAQKNFFSEEFIKELITTSSSTLLKEPTSDVFKNIKFYRMVPVLETSQMYPGKYIVVPEPEHELKNNMKTESIKNSSTAFIPFQTPNKGIISRSELEENSSQNYNHFFDTTDVLPSFVPVGQTLKIDSNTVDSKIDNEEVKKTEISQTGNSYSFIDENVLKLNFDPSKQNINTTINKTNNIKEINKEKIITENIIKESENNTDIGVSELNDAIPQNFMEYDCNLKMTVSLIKDIGVDNNFNKLLTNDSFRGSCKNMDLPKIFHSSKMIESEIDLSCNDGQTTLLSNDTKIEKLNENEKKVNKIHSYSFKDSKNVDNEKQSLLNINNNLANTLNILVASLESEKAARKELETKYSFLCKEAENLKATAAEAISLAQTLNIERKNSDKAKKDLVLQQEHTTITKRIPVSYKKMIEKENIELIDTNNTKKSYKKHYTKNNENIKNSSIQNEIYSPYQTNLIGSILPKGEEIETDEIEKPIIDPEVIKEAEKLFMSFASTSKTTQNMTKSRTNHVFKRNPKNYHNETLN